MEDQEKIQDINSYSLLNKSDFSSKQGNDTSDNLEKNNFSHSTVQTQDAQEQALKENLQSNPKENDSLFSESYDTYSKLSSSFLATINDEKPIQKEQNKDEIINSLATRVTSLENLCASLISQINFLQETHYQNFEMQKKIQNLNAQNFATNTKGSNNGVLRVGNKERMNAFENCPCCKELSFLSKTNNFKCQNCSKFVCNSCLISCETCKTVICKTCAKCNICKQTKYCWNCKSSCNQCIKNEKSFCVDCIRDCGLCKSKFCKKCCNFKCSDCKTKICLMCSWNCKVCIGNFCTEYPSDVCKVCGIRTCLKCMIDCESCKKKACKNCQRECFKCGQKCCKKCTYKSLKTAQVLCNSCPS